MSFTEGDKVKLVNGQGEGIVLIVWGAEDTTVEGDHYDYTVKFPDGEIDDFDAEELTTT